MYPYLQGGWGVSLDDIKTFAVFDILKYSVLNTPATLIPRGWKEVVGGTRTYVQALAQSFKRVRVKRATTITSIERVETGYRTHDSRGDVETYDHIVLATNANQAADALASTEGAEKARSYLRQFRYFATTIALHGDTRLMPPVRRHWSTVNIRYDGQFSQCSVWRPRHGDAPEAPVFKSWVTHESALPDKLYATARYLHPRVDRTYFSLQKHLQRLQGRNNLWLAGMYMVDVDCHESVVLSAVNVARRLAPQSARLAQLAPLAPIAAPSKPEGD